MKEKPASADPRQRHGESGQHIESWLDLARLIEELGRQGAHWIFRGEPSTTYELRPASGREGVRGSARTVKYDVKDERAALARFRYDAQPYVNNTSSYSDLEWLAIAQHYGMATRLLDWTESLLVAAFFAVEQAGAKGEALIYGVSGLPVLTPKQAHDPFDIDQVSIYRPPHVNARIAAQRSVFTVHPDPLAPFVHPGLQYWIISPSACNDLKVVLDSCAINYASMFPDLQGLAMHVGWRYKCGMSQGYVSDQ